MWASTQAVDGTARPARLLQQFEDRRPDQGQVHHAYMGGGFGSKFGPDIQGIVAAELARKAKAPVKLMLDRAEEITVGGNRPSAYGKVKIAGTKDGTITAYRGRLLRHARRRRRRDGQPRLLLRLLDDSEHQAQAHRRPAQHRQPAGPCGPRAIRRAAS